MKEYSYNIINDVYNWMTSRRKNVEIRLLNDKSKNIQVGDNIIFNNRDNVGKFVKVKVLNKVIVDNVEEVFNKFNIERIMPGHTKEEFIDLMSKIYRDELIDNKIVLFEFEYLNRDSEVTILEYNEEYLEDVKDLLVELEEYIISIDKDGLDQLHPEYRDKMALLDLQEVEEYNGKCYLAIENKKVIGLIMGCIPPYDEFDYLDYKCPKKGEITELIVTNKTRSKGIGQLLINRMEEYFKSMGCEFVLVDVFAYNYNAIKFYEKKGYHSRMHIQIKKLD